MTVRFRLSWSIPAVVGLLLFILGLLAGRSHGFPAYDCHNRSNHVEVYSLLEPASCHAASTDLRVERMLPAEIIQIRKTRTIPVLRCLACGDRGFPILRALFSGRGHEVLEVS